MCKHREQCWRKVSKTDSESLSDVKKTISSIVRNFPNRSRENAKIRILKVTIITPNCQLFGGDIHPSWVTYTSQEPSGNRHESPYACGNYRVSKPSTHMFHCAAQKNPFNTSAKALSFLLQLLDRSFLRINASGLPRHCGVTLVAPSGNWVFFRKIATSTSLTQTMQRYPSCQTLSILHGAFTLIKTTEAASRKDTAAEMQRHVLPLSRDTKTWLTKTCNTYKPSPRAERERQSYRLFIVTQQVWICSDSALARFSWTTSMYSAGVIYEKGGAIQVPL